MKVLTPYELAAYLKAQRQEKAARERAMGFLAPNKRICGPKLTDLKAPTPAVVAAKTNARYKVGQAAYMRAYRARKKAEKAGGDN